MKVRKAVIPAAGLGTRFLPATKAQAKMLPIVDKPTIQYIKRGCRGGLEEILLLPEEIRKPSRIISINLLVELALKEKGETEP